MAGSNTPLTPEEREYAVNCLVSILDERVVVHLDPEVFRTNAALVQEWMRAFPEAVAKAAAKRRIDKTIDWNLFVDDLTDPLVDYCRGRLGRPLDPVLKG